MSKMRLCVWCRKSRVKTKKNRFCCRSCSAQWRMTQPDILAAVHGPAAKAKRKAGIRKAWADGRCENTRTATKSRMLENNPMHCNATRAKVSNTLREKGHAPRVRGGNGRPLPRAHKMLAEILGWPVEWTVATGKGRGHHYSIDIANPSIKVAVEVDGKSHKALLRKKTDSEKDEYLRSQGWLVLRVSNEQVLQDPGKIAACIVSKSVGRARTF